MIKRIAIVRIESIHPGSNDWTAALSWCRQHAAATLMIAGDMTAPLVPLTRHEAAFDGPMVLGVAASFSGFSMPAISVASTRADVVDALLRRFDESDAILAIEADQPVPTWCGELAWSTDPWLVAECVRDSEAEAATEIVTDASELAAFYEEVGSTYWCPAMLAFGHSYVVRDERRSILSAGSVQFVIDAYGDSYAHIGALATSVSARGRSAATLVLRALRAGLVRAGVRSCGVLADAGTSWLPNFYERRGFSRRGAFRFATLEASSWPELCHG